MSAVTEACVTLEHHCLRLADENEGTHAARCWQGHIHGHNFVCTAIDIRCSDRERVGTEHGWGARDVSLIRTADAGQGKTCGQCTIPERAIRAAKGTAKQSEPPDHVMQT